eukprot:883493-Pelagomonas_calceolata.AAC.3
MFSLEWLHSLAEPECAAFSGNVREWKQLCSTLAPCITQAASPGLELIFMQHSPVHHKKSHPSFAQIVGADPLATRQMPRSWTRKRREGAHINLNGESKVNPR